MFFSVLFCFFALLPNFVSISEFFFSLSKRKERNKKNQDCSGLLGISESKSETVNFAFGPTGSHYSSFYDGTLGPVLFGWRMRSEMILSKRKSGDERKARRKRKRDTQLRRAEKRQEGRKKKTIRAIQQAEQNPPKKRKNIEILTIANCLNKQLESQQGAGPSHRLCCFCNRNQNFCAADKNAGGKNQLDRRRPSTGAGWPRRANCT